MCVTKYVFVIANKTEMALFLATNDFKVISHLNKGKINHIVQKVVNNIIANESVFSGCSEVINYISNRIDLMKLTIQEYIRIRLYALGKLMTEKVNAPSKRHELTNNRKFFH